MTSLQKQDILKSDILTKIANMLMELDNNDFVKIHLKCKDIQKYIEEYNHDNALLSYALMRAREE